MEIRVLQYFLAVVNEGGMNRAADALFITQPTLSRQIAQLESELGVKLFERRGRNLHLTEEGMLLRRRAEEILTLVNRTEKELVEQEGQVDGQIVIGGGELSTMFKVAQILDGFHEKYPLVTFELITANADNTKEQMEKGLVDIGVLLEPVEIDKFDFIRLKEAEHWVAIMRADDPLAQKQSVTPADLATAPLILPRRSNVRNEVHQWLSSTGESHEVLLTSNLNTNGAVMVNQGLARSIALEGAVRLWDDRKIATRLLSPSLTSSCVLAWKKGQPKSTPVAKFIEYCQYFLSIEDPSV